jgi:lipoprotein-anchoring transpeptidase ErfK/SrfK
MSILVAITLFASLFLPVELSFVFSAPEQQLAQVQAASTENQVNTNCESPYIVRPGDFLRKIARTCGFTYAELVNANPQIANPNRIYVGQAINLPGMEQEEPVEAETAQAEDLVPGTGAEPVRVSTNTAAALDPMLAEPEEPRTVSVEGDQVHTVVRGDTIGKIARKYGVTTNQIMFVNMNLLNPNVIHVGQKIIIPPADLEVPRDAWINNRINASVLTQQRAGVNYTPTSSDERWIHVDLATQTVHAYQGNEIVRSFIASTGKPSTPTVTGTYKVWIKLRSTDMRGPGYHLRNVPYVMYFYRGYGLHGTYWHNDFGTPRSAGCVNMVTEEAAWLYDFASVGTVVNVQ